MYQYLNYIGFASVIELQQWSQVSWAASRSYKRYDFATVYARRVYINWTVSFLIYT